MWQNPVGGGRKPTVTSSHVRARNSECVLEALDVSKSYQRGDRSVRALHGVTFSVSSGECVAVVGPSGCGKSTLLHLCGAMDRSSHGTVHFNGRDLGSLDDDELTRLRRQQVGFVFQSFNLLPTLTVAQNIGLPLLLGGQAERSVITAVGVVAERVGLSSRLDHLPQQLSGGEAQRAAIARAVIHQPVVLIADEPTGNLDSENGIRVLELLIALNRDSNTSIILATHDDYVATRMGRIVHMRDGQIVDPSS
jgi:putative ABC transport system ATP-binding protein